MTQTGVVGLSYIHLISKFSKEEQGLLSCISFEEEEDFMLSAENKRPTGRRHKFPIKLMILLEIPRYSEVIRWNESGDAFIILQPNKFEKEVMNQYFNFQRKHDFQEFQRKLEFWGFKMTLHKSTSNTISHKRMETKTIFHHLKFRRGDYNSCKAISLSSSKEAIPSAKVSAVSNHLMAAIELRSSPPAVLKEEPIKKGVIELEELSCSTTTRRIDDTEKEQRKQDSNSFSYVAWNPQNSDGVICGRGSLPITSLAQGNSSQQTILCYTPLIFWGGCSMISTSQKKVLNKVSTSLEKTSLQQEVVQKRKSFSVPNIDSYESIKKQKKVETKRIQAIAEENHKMELKLQELRQKCLSML